MLPELLTSVEAGRDAPVVIKRGSSRFRKPWIRRAIPHGDQIVESQAV
jgi:hypothetical protein